MLKDRVVSGRRPSVVIYASAAAVLTVLALVAACTGGGNEPPAPTATPSAATAAPAPPTAVSVGGRALFIQSCSACHGVDLQGTDRGPPFLNRIYGPGHHADAAFRLAVQRGVISHHWRFGNMPKIEGLTDEQVEEIIKFVREQQALAGIH